MAMSYHMEARIKQDRLNRWHELKRRAEMEPSQGMGDKLEDLSNKQKKESVLVTDPGQFHQIRSQTASPRRAVPSYETGVIFKKVVHDPNFNFRLEAAMGGNLLHVNPIYKIIYPGSFTYRRA